MDKDKSTTKKIMKEKFWLLVGEGKMEEKLFNPIELPDKSIFQDYNKLLNKANYSPSSRKCIILTHPKLGTLKISNEQEWNFLYNNNIINECIKTEIKGRLKDKIVHKLNIYFQSPDIEVDAKYSDILENIMNKISPDFYITQLLNFLNQRKDIVNEFKLYLIKNLQDSKENQDYNNMISINLNEKKNKFIVDTNKFFKILEIKLNNLRTSYQTNINKIESSEIFENISDNFKINEKNEDKSNQSIFYAYRSSPILYRPNMNERNLFEVQSQEDFNEDIKYFKKKLMESLSKLKYEN